MKKTKFQNKMVSPLNKWCADTDTLIAETSQLISEAQNILKEYYEAKEIRDKQAVRDSNNVKH